MEVLPGVREGRRQEKGLLGAYSRHSPSQVMEQVTLRVPAPSQTTVVPPIRYSESAARKLLCQDLSHPSKGLLRAMVSTYRPNRAAPTLVGSK